MILPSKLSNVKKAQISKDLITNEKLEGYLGYFLVRIACNLVKITGFEPTT